MSKKTLPVVFTLLLALSGCRENQTVDPNNAPEARAELKGEDAVSEGSYEVELSGSTVTLTLDGSESTDRDGEVEEYIWISATLDPAGSGGRFIPEDEDADWPSDGETTTVKVGEGFWAFSLYVKDDEGAVSAPTTIEVKVGDPDPIPMAGADSGSGDGAAAASPEDCIAAASALVSEACADCTCNGGGSCAADVTNCDETCWGLINCVATECAGSATDTACIVGACGPFLGAATAATAAGTCASACTDECAM